MGAIRAWIKCRLMRWFLVDEFCRDCGARIELIWTASEDTWARYAGANQPPLCPTCFTDRARRASVLLRWVPLEMACKHEHVSIDTGEPGGYSPWYECQDCKRQLGPV
jgi:hypothetical protein